MKPSITSGLLNRLSPAARTTLISLALGCLTFICYYPVSHLNFIYYDDFGEKGYVVDNTNIQSGFTYESVRWAFTTTRANNWHPVTWLSHILDCRVFGLNPAGHHITSLAFHIANTLLLFLLLQQLTRALWRSTVVAALFGWHPLHIQSVAWVSERKDVLSAFFFLLTLLAYTQYAQKSEARMRRAKSGKQVSGIQFLISGHYWLALVFFVLGLMCKPMLVTLPIILMLLDYWPLQRNKNLQFTIHSLKPLLAEKIPFLILSLASCVITVQAQDTSVVPMDYVPLDWRVGNALTAYSAYLGKTFWPVHLAIFYPFTKIPLWQTINSGLLLTLLTVLLMRKRRSFPSMLTGWLWFLVMLIPVVGLVQVSVQAMADRYVYLPSIGLFILLVWGIADITVDTRLRRTVLWSVAAAALCSCLWLSRWQLEYWRDSVTLFTRAVAVTGENPLVNYFLGNACYVADNLDGAARNYRIVLRSTPDVEDVHYRLGCILQRQSKWPEAQSQFSEVLRLNPSNPFACKFLGDDLSFQGKFTEAATAYADAQQLLPNDQVIQTAARVNAQKAEIQKILDPLLEKIGIHPTAETHAQIAELRELQGNFQEALQHYFAALQLQPEEPKILNNIAWLLVACPDKNLRDGLRAVTLAQRACELSHFEKTIFIGTLAAAYAEAGKFDEAVATAQHACDRAAKNGEADLRQKNQMLLARYRAHKTALE